MDAANEPARKRRRPAGLGDVMSEELKARIAALRSKNPWQAIDLLAAEVERLSKENAELKQVPTPKRRSK